MKRFFILSVSCLFVLIASTTYSQSGPVDHFHQVIISPYIQATFVQGDQERVVINNCIVDSNKLHVEVKGGTLRVYLDGAKEIPHNQRDKNGNGNEHIYPNSAVEVTIIYRKLDALSLRGKETFVCRSALSAETFTLNLYGESTVTFAEVHFDRMHTTIYGKSSVVVQSGSVNKQIYTCYGEGKVNTTAISSEEARLTAYGEADFSMNVSGRIKITSFGEARLRYKGNPDIVKGIHVGGIDVQRLD